MDLLPLGGLILAIVALMWLLASLYQFGAQSFEAFDAAIIPKYPSAMQVEQMNTGVTTAYQIYPRIPPGTQLTNW